MRKQVVSFGPNQWIIGSEVEHECRFDSVVNWSDVDRFIQQHQGEFIFLALSYELGLDILEVKASTNKPRLSVPKFIAWTAKNIWKKDQDTVIGLKGNSTFHKLEDAEIPQLQWTSVESFEKYVAAIDKVQTEIQYGNVYELNYCTGLKANGALKDDALSIFHRLQQLIQAPHACFYEDESCTLISMSPERFFKTEGSTLISQPIKGTAPRGKNTEEDEEFAKQLRLSLKDRVENTMIVDLVRNDCSKIASKGSVQVPEFMGLYSFAHVHQLISTVSCEMKDSVLPSDIIKALFPMGSMTGAPKKSAVALSEQFEPLARNWYSGSFGCITPEGNWDLNVIIRSVFHDKKTAEWTCMVGGAITNLSNAADEWNECKVKVDKLLQHFGTCQW